MVNSLWFALRLRLLSKRTSKILDNIQKSSFDSQDGLEMLERETNICLAMLQQLVDYAQKHHCRLIRIKSVKILSKPPLT
jgi:UV DNA damage repair endonuclease